MLPLCVQPVTTVLLVISENSTATLWWFTNCPPERAIMPDCWSTWALGNLHTGYEGWWNWCWVQTAGASHLKRVSYSRNTCFLCYSVSRQGQKIFFLVSVVSRQGLGAIQFSKGAGSFNMFGILMPKNFGVKLFCCIYIYIVASVV